MSGVPRAAPLLVLLLVAVALGACGEKQGDTEQDKKAYVAKVNAVQEQFASEVTTVTSQYTAKSSPDEDQKTLRGFETAIGSFVDQLRAIKVPVSLKAEHTQLVGAMSGYATDIQQATAALTNPTTRTLADASDRIRTATQTVNTRLIAAREAINAKLSAQ
ncbi:MAG TPA: hypothetical protein VF526_01800 [Solirubrobacteraceae bacterium]|jgi:hypothetical protein